MGAVPDRIARSPFPIRQGEHLAITGRTGSGKSAAARAILAGRRYLILLRTKRDDVPWRVDRRVTTSKAALSAMGNEKVGRIEVEPPYDAQSDVFYDVLAKAYQQGGWTVAIDEGYELKRLGLVSVHEKMLTQGRSLGISVVTCMQRPAWVTRFAISEPSHVISFHHDGRDAKTLKECVAECHYDALAGLPPYHFAWTAGSPPRSWRGTLQDLA